MTQARLTFLGAVGTVTGSKYLLETDNTRLLIDCGLFQGFKQLRLKNWASLPVDPASIDAVVLTHAHIDHSGYVPLLVRNGFKGPVHCTPETQALCEILLPDSGFLQEKDAERANRYGYTKHKPALPLYTQKDAERSLEQFKSVDFEKLLEIGDFRIKQYPAGHILGAASLDIEFAGRHIVFSGDIGRFHHPFMNAPVTPPEPDYIVIESTYGDRDHETNDPAEALEQIVNRTAGNGGTVIIPSFAVGRAQEILYHLHILKTENRIPDIPVFLDSPMAIDASDLFCRFARSHRLSRREAQAVCATAQYVRSADQSAELDLAGTPKIIISASGMATGGRVLHHIKELAGDHRNALVFVGFQAGGTRGEALVAGAETVRIHGQDVTVRAGVYNLTMLSAHADADELIRWLTPVRQAPRQVFITHGEPRAADSLRKKIERHYSWNCHIPDYLESVTLD